MSSYESSLASLLPSDLPPRYIGYDIDAITDDIIEVNNASHDYLSYIFTRNKNTVFIYGKVPRSQVQTSLEMRSDDPSTLRVTIGEFSTPTINKDGLSVIQNNEYLQAVYSQGELISVRVRQDWKQQLSPLYSQVSVCHGFIQAIRLTQETDTSLQTEWILANQGDVHEQFAFKRHNHRFGFVVNQGRFNALTSSPFREEKSIIIPSRVPADGTSMVQNKPHHIGEYLGSLEAYIYKP